MAGLTLPGTLAWLLGIYISRGSGAQNSWEKEDHKQTVTDVA